MEMIVIHCDGACKGNPGPGGWAALLEQGQHSKLISGHEPSTTNNIMELTAATNALMALKSPGLTVSVFSDSQYLINGMNDWVYKWSQTGWKTSTKQPVKNKELWLQLMKLCEIHNVSWTWIPAYHNDPRRSHPQNDIVDKAATAAIGNAIV